MFTSATSASIGIAAGIGADRLANSSTGQTHASQAASDVVPFYGPHQAGIATPSQNYLQFAAFDFNSSSLSDLRELMAAWTRAAATLTTGHSLSDGGDPNQAPTDPGEATGLPAASLTLTFGLGPALFEQDGSDRLGLRPRKPPELSPLPPFRGEAIDPKRSGGDLCIQACADDPQAAFHAIHLLARLANPAATIRWLQGGFGRTSTTSRTQETPRNLMGFKDGTHNIHSEDHAAMNQHVWVSRADEPGWMRGGTYLVLRRIRMLLDVWDATSLRQQERTIGRQKSTGAPLGMTREQDPVPLAAISGGAPIVPTNAHIRLASPELNAGQRLLRRGYSYSDGYDPATGQLDAGLVFIAFQRSPTRQFIPLQRRLATSDALNHHTLHTATAIFAIPPGVGASGHVAETLL